MRQAMTIRTLVEEVSHSSGVLAIFGGVAYYLWKVKDGKEFRFWAFTLNIILAFYVGYLSGKFLPLDIQPNYRDGLISISGFLAFPILQLVEDYGIVALQRTINWAFRRVGIDVEIPEIQASREVKITEVKLKNK